MIAGQQSKISRANCYIKPFVHKKPNCPVCVWYDLVEIQIAPSPFPKTPVFLRFSSENIRPLHAQKRTEEQEILKPPQSPPRCKIRKDSIRFVCDKSTKGQDCGLNKKHRYASPAGSLEKGLGKVVRQRGLGGHVPRDSESTKIMMMGHNNEGQGQGCFKCY